MSDVRREGDRVGRKLEMSQMDEREETDKVETIFRVDPANIENIIGIHKTDPI